jgi:ubiquinone/menaquinone biosynthesis C-methylase UbiE
MNSSSQAEFTYQNFESLLEILKHRFELRLIGEGLSEAPIDPTLFLRHDVDVSLKRALTMAEIEWRHGVPATYMIIPNSILYDLRSHAASAALRQLIEMDHEVALHLDLREEDHRKNLADITEEINHASRLIEDITRIPVRSFSFHRPPPHFLNGPKMVGDRVNAYSKELMTNYVSDSKGRWNADLWRTLKTESGAVNQLLLHPIWWGVEHLSAEERLKEFCEEETRGDSLETSAEFAAKLALTLPGVAPRADLISTGAEGAGSDWSANVSDAGDASGDACASVAAAFIGKFDTDTEALNRRIESHSLYGSNNLESWAFDYLELRPGLHILDLGCGNGKQTIPLAELVGKDGRVLALDVSAAALEQLSNHARSSGLADRIDTARAELDDLAKHLEDRRFDRVISCYALYYARDPHAVLNTLRQTLNPKGLIFFCGPAGDNNAELKCFHYALRGEKPKFETAASRFMTDTGPRLAQQLFSEVRTASFENLLAFDSPESLHQYWSSYNLFDPEMDSEFKRAASQYFEGQRIFETTKRVIGIQAVV